MDYEVLLISLSLNAHEFVFMNSDLLAFAVEFRFVGFCCPATESAMYVVGHIFGPVRVWRLLHKT